jgi:hypothetical protein
MRGEMRRGEEREIIGKLHRCCSSKAFRVLSEFWMLICFWLIEEKLEEESVLIWAWGKFKEKRGRSSKKRNKRLSLRTQACTSHWGVCRGTKAIESFNIFGFVRCADSFGSFRAFEPLRIDESMPSRLQNPQWTSDVEFSLKLCLKNLPNVLKLPPEAQTRQHLLKLLISSTWFPLTSKDFNHINFQQKAIESFIHGVRANLMFVSGETLNLQWDCHCQMCEKAGLCFIRSRWLLARFDRENLTKKSTKQLQEVKWQQEPCFSPKCNRWTCQSLIHNYRWLWDTAVAGALCCHETQCKTVDLFSTFCRFTWHSWSNFDQLDKQKVIYRSFAASNHSSLLWLQLNSWNPQERNPMKRHRGEIRSNWMFPDSQILMVKRISEQANVLQTVTNKLLGRFFPLKFPMNIKLPS